MIYALLMTAGILEFIFALILVLHFFDHEAEMEAAYQEGVKDGMLLAQYEASNHMRPVFMADALFTEEDLTDPDLDAYYDALADEANH